MKLKAKSSSKNNKVKAEVNYCCKCHEKSLLQIISDHAAGGSQSSSSCFVFWASDGEALVETDDYYPPFNCEKYCSMTIGGSLFVDVSWDQSKGEQECM